MGDDLDVTKIAFIPPACTIICPTLSQKQGMETLSHLSKKAGADIAALLAHSFKRRGWVEPVEAALRYMVDKRTKLWTPYVCFVNDDIRIKQYGWLARMIEALESNGDYMMATPSGFCRTQPICHSKPGMPKEIQVVSQLPFFCTVVKRFALFDTILPDGHFLDLRFVHYGADSDLCERVKLAGYKLIWVKDIWVENQESEIMSEWKKHDLAIFREKWGWGG